MAIPDTSYLLVFCHTVVTDLSLFLILIIGRPFCVPALLDVIFLFIGSQVAAEGVVVDSAVVRGKGAVADILVTWGRLKPRDVVVAGTEYGKVRM